MAEVSGVQHQKRRSVTAQLSTFVGSTGESMADMSLLRTVLSDGVTAGGWPMQKSGVTLLTFQQATLGYNVLITDATVVVPTNLGIGAITLPSAKTYPAGQKLVIADGGGNASVNAITVNANTSTEKIVGITNAGGAFGSTSFTINGNGTG